MARWLSGVVVALMFMAMGVSAQVVVPAPDVFYKVDFEKTLPPDSYWNGSDLSGGFLDEVTFFQNCYNTNYASWSGFARSTMTDTNTPGYPNQYSVWTPGRGVDGSPAYAVVYDNSWKECDVVHFPFPTRVQSMYINNTTYAALDMLNGSAFSKKFGGATGDDPDWFRLVIQGEDAQGQVTGQVEFYLADYRFADNTKDYIVGDWTKVDLRALGSNVRSMHFYLLSSDSNALGMNTPAYFAMDDLEYERRPGDLLVDFEDLDVPPNGYWNGSDLSGKFYSEWVEFKNVYNTNYNSWIGFSSSRVNDTNTPGYPNQYAVWGSGKGMGETGTYAVAYCSTFTPSTNLKLPIPASPKFMYINNTTYAALDMLNGSVFSKKFGGETGDDPDWLKVTISGYDFEYNKTGEVEFYLADYRFANNALDYIVSDWTKVDLTPLGQDVIMLDFTMSSSDNGAWGMSTPAYFAMDNLCYGYPGTYKIGLVDDIDGDSSSDFVVFRPSDKNWIGRRSSDGSNQKRKFGIRGDVPVATDYDGDGRTDVAVFRRATGWWYGINSHDGSWMRQKWGIVGDVAVPADYDADGKADLAVFRPATQWWIIKHSLDSSVTRRKFGIADDIPVPADYDGDFKDDIAVYRPSTGWWYVLKSSDGTRMDQKWGVPGDVAVPADYDGDGIADFAIFRPSTQQWVIKRSSDGVVVKKKFGIEYDIPVPGDYDGDGKIDICVFRPSTGWWYILSATGARWQKKWGVPGDEPVWLQYRIYKMMD